MVRQEVEAHLRKLMSAEKYKQRQLRKKGFSTKAEAEKNLREAMNDVDALERGEIRCKPTTAQEALNIYRRKLEVRSKDKGYQHGHNLRSNCKIVKSSSIVLVPIVLYER
jgi:hypothetical protein